MAPVAPDFGGRGNAATRWCGTYHNPEKWFGPAGIVGKLMMDDDVDILAAQEEVCPTTGRPHIQLFIKMKKKVRFQYFKNYGFPETVHWEVAKAKTDALAIAYCFKDDTHPHGSLRWAKGCKVPKPIAVITNEEMVTWQRQLIEYVKRAPDVRRTLWIWSTTGGVGKTRIAKYLAVKEGAMVFNGKGADVFNGIIQWHEKKGEWPEIMVMNVPLVSKDYVSVTALEAIKDGMFYSGKFEGGQCLMNPPHLIVFANTPPPYDKMTENRFIELRVDDPGARFVFPAP